MRLLLLAGTEEARRLSRRLASRRDIDLVSSLAGVTRTPGVYPGTVRRGGFGGVLGFRRYLSAAGIDAVIDATHPFAQTMSATAASVTADLGLPLLRLERPEWSPGPADRWTMFGSLAAAIAAIPECATAFLATGVSSAELVLPPRARLVLRAIEPPRGPLPANVEVILARPPFPTEAEEALFRAHGVTHLVCKNSGGASGRAKLEAAAALGLPVHMVRRPAPPAPPSPIARTEDEALRWLEGVAKTTPPAASRA